jgi:hypothetical protein
MNKALMLSISISMYCSATFGGTTIKFQSAFSSGDRFVTANKARTQVDGEYQGIGFKNTAAGAISIGTLRHAAAQSAELGAVAEATAASDSNKRALADVKSGNFGGIVPVVSMICQGGFCDGGAINDLGTLPNDPYTVSEGAYCFGLGTCTPSGVDTYDNTGLNQVIMDGEYLCARAVYYDYTTSGGSIRVDGSPDVVCSFCNCP